MTEHLAFEWNWRHRWPFVVRITVKNGLKFNGGYSACEYDAMLSNERDQDGRPDL